MRRGLVDVAVAAAEEHGEDYPVNASVSKLRAWTRRINGDDK